MNRPTHSELCDQLKTVYGNDLISFNIVSLFIIVRFQRFEDAAKDYELKNLVHVKISPITRSNEITLQNADFNYTGDFNKLTGKNYKKANKIKTLRIDVNLTEDETHLKKQLRKHINTLFKIKTEF